MLIVAVSTIGFTVLSASAAQNYPGKPIRMIVPLAPGGTGDTLARLTGDLLGAAFDQSVIIDNRPGANGIIGMELVAQAAADGYTLLFGSSGNVVLNAALRGSELRINVEKKLLAQGAFPSGAKPASLAALLKTEIAKWSKVVKDADIKAQ